MGYNFSCTVSDVADDVHIKLESSSSLADSMRQSKSERESPIQFNFLHQSPINHRQFAITSVRTAFIFTWKFGTRLRLLTDFMWTRLKCHCHCNSCSCSWQTWSKDKVEELNYIVLHTTSFTKVFMKKIFLIIMNLGRLEYLWIKVDTDSR